MLIILFLQNKGFRYVEALVALILLIAGCFLYELVVSHPLWIGALQGLLPVPQIITNPSALYLAIGILGATVMPHNLYLHSNIVQTRNFARNESGKARAIRYATADSTQALFFAFFKSHPIFAAWPRISSEGSSQERCAETSRLSSANRLRHVIAMATHGHGFLADLFLGSVSREVRHQTDIPVLLIRDHRRKKHF